MNTDESAAKERRRRAQMLWWNAMTPKQRLEALQAAGPRATPADAYYEFELSQREKEHANRPDRPNHRRSYRDRPSSRRDP